MEYVLTTDHLCKNYGHFKAEPVFYACPERCNLWICRKERGGENYIDPSDLRTAKTDIRKLQVIWKRKYGQENFGSAEKNRRSCGDPVDLSGYDGGRKHERAVLCFGLAVF